MTQNPDNRIGYDPTSFDPTTPREAYVFALAYDGQRPSLGCPLAEIIPGLAPLVYINQAFLTDEQKPLLRFYDIIRVPAMLLTAENVSLTLPLNRQRKRWLLGTQLTRISQELGLFPDKHHPPPELMYVMFRLPDGNAWKQTVVIISDMGKSPEKLQQEIRVLHTKSAHPGLIGIKHAIYYIKTADTADMDFSGCPSIHSL